MSLRHCEVDQAMFYRLEKKALIILVVHVDDLSIVASSMILMDEVKTRLSEVLKLTDMGEFHQILRMSVQRDWTWHTISLRKTSYIHVILQHFDKAPHHSMDPR